MITKAHKLMKHARKLNLESDKDQELVNGIDRELDGKGRVALQFLINNAENEEKEQEGAE
jgi:hypothetical protein